MAEYRSKYRELSFYVGDEKYTFSNGSFSTDDPKIVAVLDSLSDAVRADAPNEQPEVTEAPIKATRKPSGK